METKKKKRSEDEGQESDERTKKEKNERKTMGDSRPRKKIKKEIEMVKK